MDYAFRIIRDAATTDPSVMNGEWNTTSHVAGTLLDKQNLPVGIFSNKMGTSIPSFFARMELFRVAFDAKEKSTAPELDVEDLDTKLISECLDMLELLFQYGNDQNHLVIKCWNYGDEIAKLRGSASDEHKRLADVLETQISEINKSRGKGMHVMDDIYLFYWKESVADATTPKEILIGGTSPYTLVFTSPNWKRKAKAIRFDKKRFDGSSLFFDQTGQEVFKSLGQRSSIFKNYLYSILDGFSAKGIPFTFPTPNEKDNFNFLKYIFTYWVHDGRPAISLGQAQSLECPNNGNPRTVSIPYYYEDAAKMIIRHDISILYRDTAIMPLVSGYQMIPTSQRWKSATLTKEPLVLNPKGLDNVLYANGILWKDIQYNESAVRATLLGNNVDDNRYLPGNIGIRHSFVIASDFLEDKIIKLRTEIDDTHFHVGKVADKHFILPLRKEFFRFFNTEDIDSIVELSTSGEKVIVTLHIPITDINSKTIPLTREYSEDNIVTANATNFAFFPFYYIDVNSDPYWNGKGYLNQYRVMARGNKVNLQFINLKAGIDTYLSTTSVTRSPEGPSGATKHYKVDSIFDLVEVSLPLKDSYTLKGVIVPKMKKIDTAPSYQTTFAVDFGTSNTHIAYQHDADSAPAPFTITPSDAQTVLFAATDDFNNNYINREFTPVLVGNSKFVKYPLRTASCETNSFAKETSPDLNSHISIGFNFQLEKTRLTNEKYTTDLKWLLENAHVDPVDVNRVKFYFKHTLWMLKNKSLLNGGDENFNVYLTFPQAMLAPTKNNIVTAWKNACNELGLNVTIINPSFIESIAPYNSLAHIVGGESYLNIDIGGGTNDILYVKKNLGLIESAYYSSARFAANDLWGNGPAIGAAKMPKNGFLECAEANMPPQISNDLLSVYQTLVNRSADALGFMFSNNDQFMPEQSICGESSLWSLVFIHYGAILYNVSRLLKKENLEIPPVMSFTGMGSKYIDIISSDPGDKRELTKLLLELYTRKQAPKNFKIITLDSSVSGDVKEVTANGAILGNTLPSHFKIQNSQLNPIIDYGFDTNTSIKFGDLQNPSVIQQVKEEFNTFVDTWKNQTIYNYLYNKYGLVVSDQLLNDLKVEGSNSFNTMIGLKANMPPTLELRESLFFWPLKFAIYSISTQYAKYRPTTKQG